MKRFICFIMALLMLLHGFVGCSVNAPSIETSGEQTSPPETDLVLPGLDLISGGKEKIVASGYWSCPNAGVELNTKDSTELMRTMRRNYTTPYALGVVVKKPEKIKRPAITPVVIDSGKDQSSWSLTGWDDMTNEKKEFIRYAHNDKCNVVWLDGHAEPEIPERKILFNRSLQPKKLADNIREY